jgi:DNA-directed RNA polymerase subunit RPC12/RpoP
MSVIWRKVWHCDVCSHEWVQVDGVRPIQCPRRSCRSRSWDAAAAPAPQPTDAQPQAATLPHAQLASQLAIQSTSAVHCPHCDRILTPWGPNQLHCADCNRNFSTPTS